MKERTAKIIATVLASLVYIPAAIVALVIMIVHSLISGLVFTLGWIAATVKDWWKKLIKDMWDETKEWINDDDLDYRLVNIKETEGEG